MSNNELLENPECFPIVSMMVRSAMSFVEDGDLETLRKILPMAADFISTDVKEMPRRAEELGLHNWVRMSMEMKTAIAWDREVYLSKPRRRRPQDEFDENPYMTDRVRTMHRAGKAIWSRFPNLDGLRFPTNNYLEYAVWSPKLRGIIGRDLFREVCDNMRKGYSPCGDD